jgi:hypothetical protein
MIVENRGVEGNILDGSCAIAQVNRRASRPNVPARVRRQGCSPLPPLDSTLTAPASPRRRRLRGTLGICMSCSDGEGTRVVLNSGQRCGRSDLSLCHETKPGKHCGESFMFDSGICTEPWTRFLYDPFAHPTTETRRRCHALRVSLPFHARNSTEYSRVPPFPIPDRSFDLSSNGNGESNGKGTRDTLNRGV